MVSELQTLVISNTFKSTLFKHKNLICSLEKSISYLVLLKQFLLFWNFCIFEILLYLNNIFKYVYLKFGVYLEINTFSNICLSMNKYYFGLFNFDFEDQSLHVIFIEEKFYIYKSVSYKKLYEYMYSSFHQNVFEIIFLKVLSIL